MVLVVKVGGGGGAGGGGGVRTQQKIPYRMIFFILLSVTNMNDDRYDG